MATIGTFTSTSDGFNGTIKTLNLNVKAKIVRACLLYTSPSPRD